MSGSTIKKLLQFPLMKRLPAWIQGVFYYMKEIFKDVKGYEGLYQVSNLGNVKSLERLVKHSKGGYKLVKEKLLKFGKGTGGYSFVNLNKFGIARNRMIHQLVAIAFLDHTPCGYKLVVNHIDFDKTNNNVSNLEIVTHRENSNRKHLKSSSKYVGVSWNKNSNKWYSSIKINGKTKSLGTFKCEIKAHLAYQNKLKTL